jgi:hypothetical protein
MSPKLTEAVARYAEAVGTTVDEAETELTAVVSGLAEASSAGAVPIVDAEVLRRIDTPTVTADLAVADSQLAGDGAWHRMRSTAVSVEDATRLIDVSASAVRRVIGHRPAADVELLGLKDRHGRWRVFTYQLPGHAGGGEPATRLGRRVQRSLPAGMHPVAVAAWWDAPNAGLYLDGSELSPRRWVASGFDPDQVVAAAEYEDAT